LEHGEDWDPLAGERISHEALKDGELVQHVQHEDVQENFNCGVCKVNFELRCTCKIPVHVVFIGSMSEVLVLCHNHICFIHFEEYPKCSHGREQEHVDED